MNRNAWTTFAGIHNYDNNCVRACIGRLKKREELSVEFTNDNYHILKQNNAFKGIEILDYLSPKELDGMKAEDKFRKLLDRNNISFMYIGQGPFGIERSETLLEKTKSKRADFLINVEGIGVVLFDVKCRSKKSFGVFEESFFTIPVDELISINNLKKTVLVNVWLAFCDRSTISNHQTAFYFIPVSKLMKFYLGLKDLYPVTHDFNDIRTLRIPNELFTEVKDKISFSPSHETLDENLLHTFVNLNKTLIGNLTDTIKQIAKNENCFKTKIYEELKSNELDYFHSIEVSFHLEKLIRTDVIKFIKNKPLRLIKE